MRRNNSKNARNDVNNTSENSVDNFSEKVKKANLVGEATISPTKQGEGLHKKPDHGAVYSVTGMSAKQMIVGRIIQDLQS